MDGRWKLSRSFCHEGVTPERVGLVKWNSRICLGRLVHDMEMMELMNVSCCWEMNDEMSLEPKEAGWLGLY